MPTQIELAPVTTSPISEQDVRDLLTPASRQKSSRTQITGILVTLGWTGLFLAMLDVSVNFLFAYPQDPLVTNPPKLPLYFEYGRSIEGKLDRMIGDTDETSAPLTQAGWIDDPKQLATLPTRAENGTFVAAYGMSFTFRVCDAAKQLDPNLTIRDRGGPAAPLNHSYALFRDDLGKHEADYAVIGVLASSFPALNSMSHLTWNFEFPGVFTYPRYDVQNGELQTVEPGIDSLRDFRNKRRFEETRGPFSQTLAKHDAFYSPFLFEQSVLDSSSVLRMVRRAWWQRHKRSIEARYHNRDGFTNEDRAIETARFLLVDFAARSREHSMMPIVLLFNDRGYADHLATALTPTLEEHSIAFISTHELAPASDPSNFQGDGHFRPELDETFAKELLSLIETGKSEAKARAANIALRVD
jgi:hypothetical protein